MTLEELKYPIGKFIKPKEIDAKMIEKWISTIESFPKEIHHLTKHLSEKELQLKYRPHGWSIQQVVHHCADSHMNSFIRFKLTTTENLPTIKPYYEDLWANQADYLDADIKHSLDILKGLHKRWTILLKSLSEEDLNKEFIHPEHGKKFSLKENIGIYAWHCNHHISHISKALEIQGDFDDLA